MFVLFQMIISIVLGALQFAASFFAVLSIIYLLASIIPTLAICIRRLHDTGRGGAWYFINFVPIAGPIIFLVFVCQPSNPDSRFGSPNPYAAA
ncbi:Inner membrane protein YhaI [compost metagenome]